MINNNWRKYFEQETCQDYFIKLNQFILDEYRNKTIFPPYENIYKCFELCDFDNVKVVILGQDPYHEVNQSMGLAFAVTSKVKIPPSLVNIYKELENDLKITVDKNGDLSKWAKQGVLLLNSILSVEEGKALSHKDKGWEIFTDNIIKYLNQDDSPKVFLLWGNYAQSKEYLIKNKNHYVIKSVHPSPLSAYRGFFGSKPFSKINDFFIRNGLTPIDWKL